MTNNKSTAGARHTDASPFLAFTTGTEWLKPLSETPTRLYGELFDFAATQLHKQAEFLQGLASCRNPLDISNCQVKFIQESWQSYSEEAQKVFQSLQDAATPNRPTK